MEKPNPQSHWISSFWASSGCEKLPWLWVLLLFHLVDNLIGWSLDHTCMFSTSRLCPERRDSTTMDLEDWRFLEVGFLRWRRWRFVWILDLWTVMTLWFLYNIIVFMYPQKHRQFQLIHISWFTKRLHLLSFNANWEAVIEINVQCQTTCTDLCFQYSVYFFWCWNSKFPWTVPGVSEHHVTTLSELLASKLLSISFH